MPKDIFDLSDMSDLPAELVSSLCWSKNRGKYVDLLRRAGRPLTVSEIRVALFRMTGESPGAEKVAAALAMGVKSGTYVKTARATYALPEHANVAPLKRA